MKLTRRRFLTISAAFAGFPAQANSRQGHAFEANVSITIEGPGDIAENALDQATPAIRNAEQLFSLNNPAHSLSCLNSAGILAKPDHRFLALMLAADDAQKLTDGLFDPTVKPLWQALEWPRPTDWASGNWLGACQFRYQSRYTWQGSGADLQQHCPKVRH